MRYKKIQDSINHNQHKKHTAKIDLCPPVIRKKKNYLSNILLMAIWTISR